MQVDDYANQVALWAAINGLQLDALKQEMSKKTPKTLLDLMEEIQKHTIAEAMYYTRDTHSSK